MSARASAWRGHLQELRCELVRLLREPMYVLPTLLFPALFYVMFGLLIGGRDGGDAARYLLVTYGVFGTLGAALFGVAVTVSIDRERGFMALRRALPAPPTGWLTARLVIAMLFSLLISLQLAALAMLAGGVSMAPGAWVMLWAVNLLGAVPFCAIGLLIGCVASANAAPAVVNVLFLPMAFLSGLWLPLEMLPGPLAELAPAWPAYHLAQIGLRVVGLEAGQPLWLHVAALLLVGGACAVLAQRGLRRAG